MADEKKGLRGFISEAFSFLKGSPIAKEEIVEADSLGSQQKVPVIPFFTVFNDFAIQLTQLSEVVPEHDAAIRAKRRWSVPNGFTVTRSNPSAIINNAQADENQEITTDELQEVESFISSVNQSDETLKDLTRRAVTDLETTGNGWFELIRGEVAGKRFFFIEHHDSTTALYIRRGEEITVGIAADWSQVDGFGANTVEVVELPLYKGKRTEWLKHEDGTERCIMHLKQYRAGRFWYGLPESVASLLAQKIGFEISRHNLDRLETDFFPRLFFEFYNTDGMSDKLQKQHLTKLRDTFTKESDKRFGIFVQYNEGENSKTSIQKLELDNQGDFVPYKTQVRQDILTAHSMHPVIAGVQTSGSLGSNKEIRELFDLFNSTVIKPLQDFLTEQFLTPVMTESSEWLGTMEGLFLELNTASPVSFFGKLDANKLLTINEGRNKIGMTDLMLVDEDGNETPDPRGDELISDDEKNPV